MSFLPIATLRLLKSFLQISQRFLQQENHLVLQIPARKQHFFAPFPQNLAGASRWLWGWTRFRFVLLFSGDFERVAHQNRINMVFAGLCTRFHSTVLCQIVFVTLRLKPLLKDFFFQILHLVYHCSLLCRIVSELWKMGDQLGDDFFEIILWNSSLLLHH